MINNIMTTDHRGNHIIITHPTTSCLSTSTITMDMIPGEHLDNTTTNGVMVTMVTSTVTMVIRILDTKATLQDMGHLTMAEEESNTVPMTTLMTAGGRGVTRAKVTNPTNILSLYYSGRSTVVF